MLTGGRGFEYMLWNVSTKLNELKTTYTEVFPVQAEKGISYTSLSVNSDYRFDERHEKVGYKFWGFLRPPFSGYYHVMTRSDDASEIQISTNASKQTLVNLNEFTFSEYERLG